MVLTLTTPSYLNFSNPYEPPAAAILIAGKLSELTPKNSAILL
jgi:hypothetical protein